MPVILCSTLVFVILLYFLGMKQKQIDTKTANEFKMRELNALTARKKDISQLPYRIADISALPDVSDGSEELSEVFSRLAKMDQKQLLNLSDISNTDLRLTYGAANFPFLSECDANYMMFTRDLYQLGNLLYGLDRTEEARQVLEYALSLDTDIAGTYRLLGSIYANLHCTELLASLTEKAEANLPELTRKPVLTYLSSLTTASDHVSE